MEDKKKTLWIKCPFCNGKTKTKITVIRGGDESRNTNIEVQP